MRKLFKRKIQNKLEFSLSAPWTKYYGNVPNHINYFNGTISEILEEASVKYANLSAYEYYGKTCSYKKFFKKVEACAKALKNIGVKENDHVTICMPNTPEGLISFYAVNMVGAIANMIHPLSAEKEIEFYLSISNSAYLITIDFACEKVLKVLESTTLKKIIIVRPSETLNKPLSILYWLTKGRKVKNIKSEMVINWPDFIENGKQYLGNYKCHKSLDSVAVILYSGGTTGIPKGIMLSNRNFNAMGEQAKAMCNTKSKQSVLSILPIFHGFGLTVCIHTPLISGMKCILIPDFSSKRFVSLIRKYHPNFIVGVPTLFDSLIKSKFKNNELSSVSQVISGGDTLDASLKKRIDEFLKKYGSKTEVREGYGLTECAGATCLTPINNYRENSIGIPFPDTYFKIVVSGTHDEAPINTDGEICIAGPTVMLGYLNNLEETMQTLRIHDDGYTWLHTGDIGSIDEDGFIYFKQRLKRVIVSSGYNIYPSHVESVINTHEAVLTSTVIGVAHPHKGSVAKAFVVLKDGYKPSESLKKDILNYCSRSLAKYTMPSIIEFKDSLPKTLIGKINYKELEKEHL